jgi:hypothetical protein
LGALPIHLIGYRKEVVPFITGIVKAKDVPEYENVGSKIGPPPNESLRLPGARFRISEYRLFTNSRARAIKAGSVRRLLGFPRRGESRSAAPWRQ